MENENCVSEKVKSARLRDTMRPQNSSNRMIKMKAQDIQFSGWLYKCSWCNKLTRASSTPPPNAEGPCTYKRPQGHDWIHQGWSS